MMRAPGVGPRSATAKGTAATIAALSIAAVPLGRPIAEGGRSCLRSAAQASSVLLPNGMAWRDAAMPEVRLPFRAVWLMACYSRMELTIFRPQPRKRGF